jgi:SAM-dependent methyltransferase
VDGALARTLTHGFHSYAGRMHPSTARAAIAAWSRAGQRVLDPYCGSGTVLVEAMAGGRQAVGVDASPLAVLIARVRSSVLDPTGRGQLVAVAQAIAAEAGERARTRIRPRIPVWAKCENRRFEPHVALELLGLRELVMATPEDGIGAALRACLSSILVKFIRQPEREAPAGLRWPSRARSGVARPKKGGEASRAARRIGRGIPSKFFAGRAEELARALAGLAQLTPQGTPIPAIHAGDARHLEGLGEHEFDLIVTSPPYAGIYDYVEHHDASFLWLGLPRWNLVRA